MRASRVVRIGEYFKADNQRLRLYFAIIHIVTPCIKEFKCKVFTPSGHKHLADQQNENRA